MYNKKFSKAFSLVELAIVILVLGILALAVAGGNSLVNQAKVRKVVNEFNTLVAAYRTFESTYDSVAGDMIDAYDFFGTDCTAESSDSALCNGDGDSKVEGIGGGAASNDIEYLRFFQHLKLANILEGQYTGLGATSAGAACSTADEVLSSDCLRARNVNVPKTAISTRGFYVVSYDDTTHNSNLITLGDNDTNFDALNSSTLITALNGKSIDLKLDDGLADTGRVRSGGTDCGTASYDPTSDAENCYLQYIIR